METIVTNNQMSTEEVIEAMENQINSFSERLTTGEYKVILYNGQTPILADDVETFIDCILWDMDEDSTVELKNNDVIVIHTKNETIELNGRKRMSDGEIILRKYLGEECDGSIIIKDSLEQIEITANNIKKITNSFFNKCKDVVNIRRVPEDSKHYLMNWDCLLVKFKNQDKEEIWQPA